MLDVPMEVLTQRLVQRWLDHDHTPEQARQRASANDLPNAQRVTSNSIRADLHFDSVRQ